MGVIRAAHTESVRRQIPKSLFPGRGFGKFIRTAQTLSRHNRRIQLAQDLAPLEQDRQEVEQRIADIEEALIQAEREELYLKELSRNHNKSDSDEEEAMVELEALEQEELAHFNDPKELAASTVDFKNMMEGVLSRNSGMKERLAAMPFDEVLRQFGAHFTDTGTFSFYHWYNELLTQESKDYARKQIAPIIYGARGAPEDNL
jgi:hypothetical protein